MTFEAVEIYLRNFSSQEPSYGASGAMHLLKAILENLRANGTQGDLEDYASILDEKDEELYIIC